VSRAFSTSMSRPGRGRSGDGWMVGVDDCDVVVVESG
jgi:hypothetical protein